MKNRNVFVIILLSFILLSCEKKDEKEVEDNNGIRPEFFTIGNSAGMNIIIHDTIVYCEDGNYYDIDLNNDGELDIRIQASITQSNATGELYYSKIMSLNSNIAFYGQNIMDTTFLNLDTLISVDSSIVYLSMNHRCSRISAEDSILSINENFALDFFDFDDQVEANSICHSDTIDLLENIVHFPGDECPPPFIGFEGCFYSYEYNCHIAPLDETKYIGIKFLDSYKNAWVKFKLTWNDINIIESAVQQ